MTLLAAIAQMNDGIAIDQFLYEIMVIWSAVHELEIDLLIQVYELVAASQSGKISYSNFISVLQDLFNCPDEVCIPLLKMLGRILLTFTPNFWHLCILDDLDMYARILKACEC